MNTYYFDFDKPSSGNGTQEDAFNDQDFINGGLPDGLWLCKGTLLYNSTLFPYTHMSVAVLTDSYMRGWDNNYTIIVDAEDSDYFGGALLNIQVNELSQCILVARNGDSNYNANLVIENSGAVLTLNSCALYSTATSGENSITFYLGNYVECTQLNFNGSNLNDFQDNHTATVIDTTAQVDAVDVTFTDSITQTEGPFPDYGRDFILYPWQGSNIRLHFLSCAIFGLTSDYFINSVAPFFHIISVDFSNCYWAGLNVYLDSYPPAYRGSDWQWYATSYLSVIPSTVAIGTPPYTGYNFGLYGDLRTGIGAWNFDFPHGNILDNIEEAMTSMILATTVGKYNYQWAVVNEEDETIGDFPRVIVNPTRGLSDKENNKDELEGKSSEDYTNEVMYTMLVTGELPYFSNNPNFDVRTIFRHALDDLKMLFGTNYTCNGSCDNIMYQGSQIEYIKRNDVQRPAQMRVIFKVIYSQDRQNPSQYASS